MALLLVLVVPPPRNQIETSRGLRLLYVHESHAREPKPPLVGIERRKFGLKSPPRAIPNLGVSFQIFQTPKHFRADSSCGLASQPTCPDSALDRSVLRDLKATQTGDLASNNLKDKRRTINEVRFCYLIFASIEDMYGPNGAPFCTSYLGDTADLIFRNGAGALITTHVPTTRHARVSELRPSDAARRFAGGRWECVCGRE